MQPPNFRFRRKSNRYKAAASVSTTSCSVVATAYHIQMMVGRANLRVGNHHTEKVLSLANESDRDKSDVTVGKRTLSYNVANDVSFIYTKKSAAHKSGVPYSYNFYVGQKVTVAGYYKEQVRDERSVHPRRQRASSNGREPN